MIKPHELATTGLFFGAGGFLAWGFGNQFLAGSGLALFVIFELLAIFAHNERERLREMNRTANTHLKNSKADAPKTAEACSVLRQQASER